MGTRIDELEKSIGTLMTQAGWFHAWYSLSAYTYIIGVDEAEAQQALAQASAGLLSSINM